MLQGDNVSFAYRSDPVVRQVSLAVPRGGLVGLLGPNGSGKTTLLRLLAGTLAPSEGRVTLEGEDLASIGRAALARRMAIVPQETQLAFDYSVLEMALMGHYPHLGAFAIEGPADLAIAREALAATGTLAFEARPFMTLSGGEKQRVVIASALAQFGGPSAGGNGDLLLLDEPTASLDLAYQIEIAAILRRLNQERGLTILLATHDLNLAAGLCRDLVLLREGRLVAAGPTREVLTAGMVRHVYGVEAEIRPGEGAGHPIVVPIARAGPPARGGQPLPP